MRQNIRLALDTTMANLFFRKSLIEQDPKDFVFMTMTSLLKQTFNFLFECWRAKKASIFINQLMLLKYLRIRSTHTSHSTTQLCTNIFFNNLPQKVIGEDVFSQGAETLLLMVICFTNTSLQYKSTLQRRFWEWCLVLWKVICEGSWFLRRIAYGDIHIREECEVDMLISIHGNIVIDGPTKGELYRGHEICFRKKQLFVPNNPTSTFKFDDYWGTSWLLQGQFTSSTTRAIMVVDSQESLGPHLVKGCLGMDFLDSFIGDSQSF